MRTLIGVDSAMPVPVPMQCRLLSGFYVGANMGRLFLDCDDCARRIICALFLIPLFSSHLASLCRKKRAGLSYVNFLILQRRTLKKGDWFYTSFYVAAWVCRQDISMPKLFLKSSNRRDLHKTDSAQSVNNEFQKSIRYFFEYIKKDTALKYPSKAVHIIHMMGEEIFYVRIFVCFYFLCKKIFNFF